MTKRKPPEQTTADIVDSVRKQMIWEGVAVGRVSEKDLNNLQPAIDAGVKAIFEKYPVSASAQ